MAEGGFSKPRKIAERVPQDSVLVLISYRLYINKALAAPGTHLALFADDASVYTTEKHERPVLSKLQRDLTAVKSCVSSGTQQLMKGKLRRSISPEGVRVHENVLQLCGRGIPYANNVRYLGVTFCRRMKWRL
jgi:hypothetical protein